ncbi:C40 family peptidase [Hymenobacter cheonanensis]|uniref:C40 family peptidase n=1 Tax=Hymenobacter sp. CA2-7 TaxID=3063993 RepID=UPI002713393E|nr:C40 family peptidase [Hymenobacter sp. CA2-7]MDO7884735.1 C40 family peptidase [Hymenobacter sp. CA2-7]
MKNTLLCCLAAASLALSFCFEKMPVAPASAGASAPAVAEASLLSGLTSHDGPTAGVEPPAIKASRDSLAYGYYDQTLGLKLAHTENKSLLQTVTDWLGTPYSYGASSRRGTDCSGFVTQVFKKVYGITLKRSSRSMFSTVQRVAKSDMKAGDLVFFRHGKGAIYHVGIYLKDGKFAHSACNGGVMVSSLNQPYYRHNFYSAGRVRGTDEVSPDASASDVVGMLAAAANARPE